MDTWRKVKGIGAPGGQGLATGVQPDWTKKGSAVCGEKAAKRRCRLLSVLHSMGLSFYVVPSGTIRSKVLPYVLELFSYLLASSSILRFRSEANLLALLLFLLLARSLDRSFTNAYYPRFHSHLASSRLLVPGLKPVRAECGQHVLSVH
ncbi:hypothetical protein Y032_0253g255 [Ancylostoma ceylanicum]|uniref:Uncharacterized protein n=1 Tax=Ancylostoma ceylanicum TaxID=53326 RepID=A0A016SBK1_9BILA|nr:hypothetical protein Y032_0253g255 [Ancylostoma ceylanicum]